MLRRRLGHYEIVGKLGEGGMGVVYEALDRHLDRRIALKILPPEKVSDSARKQRFIHEAKAASALNHPNIVTIYDINADHGCDYIAMELIPGRTLDETLRRKLRLPEVLKYAVQIADALAIAHAAGIVHRDLKPANVMITERGLVKVLDFGLAKLTDRSEVSEDDVTRTQRAVTEEGTVVGSAAYMSPEQAEGKKVDARSDIFSFGCVLYEMLAGQRAFQGDTRMSTMAAVVNKDPKPIAELVPGLPKELERIVSRCLRKDLDRRSQSMAEIKLALEELKEESESGASRSAPAAATTRDLSWRWVVAAVAAVAAGAILWSLLPRQTAPSFREVPLTSYSGFEGEPSLSPDGSQYAFAWDGDKEGDAQVYVSVVGRGTPLRLTNGPRAGDPSWSPDGQSLAFTRNDPANLYVIPALGGAERKIGLSVGKAAWSPDSKWLYYPASPDGTPHFGIFVSPSSGGERRQITDAPYRDVDPAISPDGRRLAFVRFIADKVSDLFIADVRDGGVGGPARRLTTDGEPKFSPVWTADDQIIYVNGDFTSDRGLFRVRASGGTPVRISGVGENAQQIDYSRKSNRLVYSKSVRDHNIWRIPLTPDGEHAGTPSRFLASTRMDNSCAYSPDGKRVAFSSNRGGARQIWLADADGGNPAPLTNFPDGIAGSPGWSPNGQTIVFDGHFRGNADIYSIRSDGGTPKRLTDNPAEDHVPVWSADGRSIYFGSNRTGDDQIYRMPAEGGQAVQITQHGGTVPRASPDGEWLYYSKLNAIWKVPVGGSQETKVVTDFRGPFSFTVARRGVYYISAHDPAARRFPLRLYRFRDGKTLTMGYLEKEPTLHISVSPDERWLLYAQLDQAVDDLVLVENFR